MSSLKETLERIWNEKSCVNPSHFNKWSENFRDGYGNPLIWAIKGRKAREKNPNKLGKIGWRFKKNR